MDKKLSGLVGTVAAIALCNAASGPAQAAPIQPDPLQVQSYAQLLEPVSNASALLKMDDGVVAEQPAGVQLVQYHHHHHHRYRRWYNPLRWGYRHHHHRYHHHHHHHHS